MSPNTLTDESLHNTQHYDTHGTNSVHASEDPRPPVISAHRKREHMNSIHAADLREDPRPPVVADHCESEHASHVHAADFHNAERPRVPVVAGHCESERGVHAAEDLHLAVIVDHRSGDDEQPSSLVQGSEADAPETQDVITLLCTRYGLRTPMQPVLSPTTSP